MKFTYGYWVNKPGVSIANIAQVRGVTAKTDRVELYTVPYAQEERGMGGPVITVEISSPLPDILRVKATHYSGNAQKHPAFSLQDKHCPLSVSETEEEVRIGSGKTELIVRKRPCEMIFYHDGEYLTRLGDRFGNCMLGTVLADGNPHHFDPVPKGSYMRAQMELEVGEKVYGLGERFTPFVKNGQAVDMWNEDGGTCSEIAYKNIPFYVTSRGCGVLVNSSNRVSFEVGTEVVTRVQFSVPGEELDFYVLGAHTPKEAIMLYTELAGKPALPPAWSFGLWLSSSFTTRYDEKFVSEIVDRMFASEIPMRVFHFDCYWMKENEWCNFTWDPAVFPDPSGMLRRLKERGVKICVWINPYIAQKSPLFAEAARKGYLLKRANGDIWQWDMWQAGMGLVDFTNPQAWSWYQNQLRTLVNMGVDCFKTDFGERIPTDCVYFDGSDPQYMHNYYTKLYNQCVFTLLEQMKGQGNACVFARSATVGGQCFPVHWGGDCTSNYHSMAESLRAGLSLTMCGFGFWSHDISGFEGTAPADVYKRWVAFGLLSTHSRLHGSSSYRVPWLFDEESVRVLSFFTKLKNKLMPYLFHAAVQAHTQGIPAMRAMVLEFPDDPGCEDLDRQYMLGDSLLVAPVLREDGKVQFYLPQGVWTNLLTNEVVSGGGWRTETYNFFSLPLFVRENTILATGGREDLPDYDYRRDLTLTVYALQTKASCTVCGTTGCEIVNASAEKQGNMITLCASACLPGMRFVLKNRSGVQAVTGASLMQEGEDTVLIPTAEENAAVAVTVTL